MVKGKGLKLLLLVLAVSGFISLLSLERSAGANSGGPPLSRTGAPAIGSLPAEPNCTTSGCHTSFALNSGPGMLTISGLPAYYLPDQEIAVTVTMNQSGRGAYGFQLTVLDGAGARAGTLVATDTTRTQLSTATSGSFAGRRYIQQSFNGQSANGNQPGIVDLHVEGAIAAGREGYLLCCRECGEWHREQPAGLHLHDECEHRTGSFWNSLGGELLDDGATDE